MKKFVANVVVDETAATHATLGDIKAPLPEQASALNPLVAYSLSYVYSNHQSTIGVQEIL